MSEREIQDGLSTAISLKHFYKTVCIKGLLHDFLLNCMKSLILCRLNIECLRFFKTINTIICFLIILNIKADFT